MKSTQSIPPHQWYSLYLSTVEIGLGTILHTLRIPLSGYILSLHQAFCLSRAMMHETQRFTPMTISTTVAILKTLSPGSKKITPMIAILAQGFLFNIGLLCLGNNMAGHLFGAVLLSFWGFIQPFLFAILIFGQNILYAFESLENMMCAYVPGVSLYIFLIGIIALKALLAMGSVFLAKSSFPLEPWVQNKLLPSQTRTHQSSQKRHWFWNILKDLMSFWFVFSLTTVTIFSVVRQDSITQTFMMLTGYLAQGILLMVLLRTLNFQSVVNYLDRKGLCSLSSNLRRLLNHDNRF